MITFHVGLHKTGSSSIQAALRLIRHRRDIRVLLPGDTDLASDRSLYRWLASQHHTNNVLVSDEGLFGEAISGYSLLEERLRFFMEAAGGHPWRVIVFLREPQTWLASLYLQTLQEGAAHSPNEFWQRVRGQANINPASLAALLMKQLPEDRLRIGFMTRNQDVVRSFFRLAELGTVPPMISGEIRENKSITPAQGVILRRLNRQAGISREEMTKYRHFFQGAATESVPGLSPFDEEVQVMIHALLDPDWQRLIQQLEGSPLVGDQILPASGVGQGDTVPHVADSFEDALVEREILQIARLAALQPAGNEDSSSTRRGAILVRHPVKAGSILARRVAERLRRCPGGR